MQELSRKSLNIKLRDSYIQCDCHFLQGYSTRFHAGLFELGNRGLTHAHPVGKLALRNPHILAPCPNDRDIPQDVRFDNLLRDTGVMGLFPIQQGSDTFKVFPGNKHKRRFALIFYFLIISRCFHPVF